MILQHIIQIAAPPSLVWSVTEDIENWPQWTPTVSSVTRLDSGPLEVGSFALLKQSGLPPAEWTVTALSHNHSFTWETKVKGIGMIATHELEPCDGGTENTLRLELTGWLVKLLGRFVRASAADALARENAGLKEFCESLAERSTT